MAIKHLIEDIKPGEGFPKIGKLHKGAARTEADLSKNRPGKDLSYFRMAFEPQFEYLEPLWNELYGGTPDVFDPVYVYGNTVAESFDFWKEEWTVTKLLHRCDGDEQVLRFDEQMGTYLKSRVPCAVPACQCKPVGRLSLLLPDFADASGVLGVVTAETHSIHDIIEIYKTLKRLESMTGTVMGIPLRFGRAPEKISVPKGKGARSAGERMKVEKSLFYLHVNEEYTRQYFLPALRAAAVTPLFAQGNAPAQLPASAESVERARTNMGNKSAPRRLPLDPPEDVVEGETDDTWTAATLKERIVDLFKDPAHCDNAIALYSNPQKDAYILSPDLSLDQADAAVRFYRSVHGKDERALFADERRRDSFIGACIDHLPDDNAVIAALDAVTNYAMSGLSGWRGDKATAWAAVLAYASGYVYENVAFSENTGQVLREITRLVCQFVQGQQEQAVQSAPAEDVVEGAYEEA